MDQRIPGPVSCRCPEPKVICWRPHLAGTQQYIILFLYFAMFGILIKSLLSLFSFRFQKSNSNPKPRRGRRESEPYIGLDRQPPKNRHRPDRRYSDPGVNTMPVVEKLPRLSKTTRNLTCKEPIDNYSLDPIPEGNMAGIGKENEVSPKRPRFLKNNTFSIGNISDPNENSMRSSLSDDEIDFKAEVEVGDFSAKEIKVIVGRNRVRIIGEKSFNSLEGSSGFNKVVQIPPNVDPLTLKSNFQDGKVLLSGKYMHKNRSWAVSKRGLMTVKDDGCARVTIELPKGISPNQVQVKTVTKSYLVVSNYPARDVSLSGNRHSDLAEDFIETFELPEDCDLNTLTKRSMGESTLVVEMGASGLVSNRSYKVSSGNSHRPRAFTL